MRLHAEVLDFIKQWEGFRAEWYTDSAGVETIGYGTTGLDGKVNTKDLEPPISEERGEELLMQSLMEYSNCVDRAVEVPLKSYEFGALVSLCYNIGCSAFGDSTLVQLLNAGESTEAGYEFIEWVWAGGQIREGLLDRRQAEMKMFYGDTAEALAMEPVQVPAAGVERSDPPSISDLLERTDIDLNG